MKVGTIEFIDVSDEGDQKFLAWAISGNGIPFTELEDWERTG